MVLKKKKNKKDKIGVEKEQDQVISSQNHRSKHFPRYMRKPMNVRLMKDI